MSVLAKLAATGKVWRLSEVQATTAAVSTGFAELDLALAGGWPQHTVIDIQSQTGIGELRLLLPLLQQRQQEGKLLICIAPPLQLGAQMLEQAGIQLSQLLILHPQNAKEAFWAAEVCLKSGCCSAVLQWQTALSVAQLKRLQLCAEQGQSCHLLLRPPQQQLALPVALSLQLSPHPQGIAIDILKRRGGRHSGRIILDWQQQYPQLCIPANDTAQPSIDPGTVSKSQGRPLSNRNLTTALSLSQSA